MSIEEDKRKTVDFLVKQVFLPHHNQYLQEFLGRYSEQMKTNILLSLQTNTPIILPPLHFDISEPIEQLIANVTKIEVIYKKHEHGG